MPKPVRAVRKTDEKKRPGWSGLIEGVIEIDPDATYRWIAKFLKSSNGNLSMSQIEKYLDDAAEVGHLADKLASKARRDYELDKERHAVWLEARKSAARTELEKDKAEGDLKARITNDMITDFVRAHWPEEYTAQKKQLEDFRAAVHALEKLPKRCEDRRNSLAKLADTTLARGIQTRTGR